MRLTSRFLSPSVEPFNQQHPMTNDALKSALNIAIALGQAIHAAGPQGIPSGHLYAGVMGKMDLPTYEAAIGFLVKQGVVKRSGHLLTSTLAA